MKAYHVINREAGYREEYYSLHEAKAAMKKHSAKGYIVSIRASGDWIPLGQIKLDGNNKTFTANARQKTKSY